MLKAILGNKVLWYMCSRYMTYILQFITTLIIAITLGPESFGIWSFLLLIINFFNIVDFGISNSLSVLLVQDKLNIVNSKKHISSGIFITGIISLLVLMMYFTALILDIPLLAKYNAKNYLPYILIVILISYFNKLFSSVYRVHNKLFEIAFYQSIIPFILFLLVIVLKKGEITFLVGAYLLGSILSLLLFVLRGDIVLSKNISTSNINTVVQKGIWLFLYNSAFYFIIYTMSFGVSLLYTVEEYGKYNFAYTLSNAVVLLIDSFTFIIFPKMIDRLKSTDEIYCKQTIDTIRSNYTTIIHLLIYLALPVFYLFCMIITKYSDAYRALCLSALALIPYSNAFGLNTYLIANNKERVLSLISIGCLILNIVFFNVLTLVFSIPYDMVFLTIILSYIIYAICCAVTINENVTGCRKNVYNYVVYTFPLRQFIPYIVAIGVIFVVFHYHYPFLLFLPCFIFVLFNKSHIRNLMKVIVTIVVKPQVVDLD